MSNFIKNYKEKRARSRIAAKELESMLGAWFVAIFAIPIYILIASIIYFVILGFLGWINVFTIILYILLLSSLIYFFFDKKNNPYHY